MASYIELPVVSHETALKIIQAAISEGEKAGIAVSAAVVDSSMNLVAFTKTNGATPHSAETSRRKANAAASTTKPTGWMPESLELKLPMAANNLLTNIPGGVPIIFDEKVVGGLGISGGTVEQDEAIAEAALKSVVESK